MITTFVHPTITDTVADEHFAVAAGRYDGSRIPQLEGRQFVAVLGWKGDLRRGKPPATTDIDLTPVSAVRLASRLCAAAGRCLYEDGDWDSEDSRAFTRADLQFLAAGLSTLVGGDDEYGHSQSQLRRKPPAHNTTQITSGKETEHHA
jgi:hypothetical protein